MYQYFKANEAAANRTAAIGADNQRKTAMEAENHFQNCAANADTVLGLGTSSKSPLSKGKYLIMCFALLAANAIFTNAQDYIVLKNGSTITAKVIGITSSEIRYVLFDNIDGPVRTIAKSTVFVIDYPNGYLVVNPIQGRTYTRAARQVNSNTNVDSAEAERLAERLAANRAEAERREAERPAAVRERELAQAREREAAQAREREAAQAREREAAQAREREAAQAREREAAQAREAEASRVSDVSINIPTTNVRNENTFAVIIANENYRREALVEFAHNDGETFKKYCIQTLGLPESNVHFTADATLNDIRSEINWLSDIARAYSGEANIIFYYAGHGIPDESSRAAYLLPVDGWGSDVRTGYRLDELFQTLGRLPARNVTVFLDACFSGTQRSGDMMTSARGVVIRASQGLPVGNMVVFSAAQGDETAFPYREQKHGMFTYFLLKKLQETRGNVTLGELGDYIATNVQRRSIVVNRRSQTPVVTPSAAISNSWREIRLK